ncbi:nitroreductase family deazaflavin-dependent oxidoreductase [soil metagenome]
MSDWNDRVIAEFRENNGTVERFGRTLVIMHTVGAKSGEPRLNPVMGIADGDAWLVAATYAGQPVDPAWAHNLRAHPDLELEVATDDATETVAVHAEELPEPARSEAWNRFTAASPGFSDYEAKTDRVFPIFRLAQV